MLMLWVVAESEKWFSWYSQDGFEMFFICCLQTSSHGCNLETNSTHAHTRTQWWSTVYHGGKNMAIFMAQRRSNDGWRLHAHEVKRLSATTTRSCYLTRWLCCAFPLPAAVVSIFHEEPWTLTTYYIFSFVQNNSFFFYFQVSQK